MFIDDMDSHLGLHLFTDDSTIYMNDRTSSAESLQRDLNAVEAWVTIHWASYIAWWEVDSVIAYFMQITQ